MRNDGWEDRIALYAIIVLVASMLFDNWLFG